jgi:hypothetical protein
MPAAKPKVKPVKLVCGILHAGSADIESLDSRLIEILGPIDLKSSVFDFIFTDYYSSEMGGDLKKRFYSFERLIGPESLPDIKNSTRQLEADFFEKSKRTINIDPGYLEESKLVLASTKNFSHRIYLRDNIWAEVTMRYVRGKFVKHDWTYPDWSQDLAIEFLMKVREKYRKQLEANAS